MTRKNRGFNKSPTAVFTRDGFRCVACGVRGELRTVHGFLVGKQRQTITRCWTHDGRWLTVDHVVPRSEGGSDYKGNLQTLCNGCHAPRGTLPARVVGGEP